MHTSFADQLAGLDLAGFSIGPAPVSTSDFPVREAVVQTLEAVWSDLYFQQGELEKPVWLSKRFSYSFA